MEELFLELLKEYGYVILYLWGILEGEMGLIMGGILSHTGDLQYLMTIFVAGLGGFTGDQIYFYVGRFNKGYIQRKLQSCQQCHTGLESNNSYHVGVLRWTAHKDL